jgi:dUTP pyrophosphatase
MRPTITIDCEVLPGGKLPTKAHDTDAGFDLYASADVVLSTGAVTRHPLNVKFKMPPGTFMEICTKSGLGSKGQLVYAGIIDEGYRGICHVVTTLLQLPHRDPLLSWMDVVPEPGTLGLKGGSKIAQGIVHPHGPHYVIRQVDQVTEDTARGAGGFGSSGT